VDLGLLEEVGEHLVGDEGVRALGPLHVVTRPQLETLSEGLETVRETRLLQHQRVACRLHRYLGGGGKFVRRWRKLAREYWHGTFAKIGRERLRKLARGNWLGAFAKIGRERLRKLAGNVWENWHAKIGRVRLRKLARKNLLGTLAKIGTRKLARNVCGNWQKNTLCNKECEIPLF
jgi:hypothetical protein